MLDIVYFRNACSISEPLVAMIDVLSKKFLIYVLRVVRRELDSKFSNWVIMCATINLIIRLLMKEETASVMIVNFKYNASVTRTLDRSWNVLFKKDLK